MGIVWFSSFSIFKFFLFSDIFQFRKRKIKIFQIIGKRGKFNFPSENNSNFPFLKIYDKPLEVAGGLLKFKKNNFIFKIKMSISFSIPVRNRFRNFRNRFKWKIIPEFPESTQMENYSGISGIDSNEKWFQ